MSSLLLANSLKRSICGIGLSLASRTMAIAMAIAMTTACFPTNSEVPSEKDSAKGSNSPAGAKKPKGKDKNQNEKPEPFVPSSKKVRFKISGELPDTEDLRIAVQPDLSLTLDTGKLQDAILDKEAKFKKGRVSITIPPLDEDLKVGRIGFAFLLTTLYIDEDQSEDFTKGDTVIAAAANTPVYARTGNFAGIGEWTRFDMESGDMVPIDGSIRLQRLDTLDPRERVTVAGPDADLAKGINLVAALTLQEALDLEGSFLDEPRPLDQVLDPEKELHTFAFETPLHKERRLDPADGGAVVPGIAELGLQLIEGVQEESDALTPESKRIALGCIRRKSGSNVIYDPVAALWVTPKKRWITNPSGAFLVLANDLRPGWNLVVAMERNDTTIAVAPLVKDLRKTLVFSKDCSFFSQTWTRARMGIPAATVTALR